MDDFSDSTSETSNEGTDDSSGSLEVSDEIITDEVSTDHVEQVTTGSLEVGTVNVEEGYEEWMEPEDRALLNELLENGELEVTASELYDASLGNIDQNAYIFELNCDEGKFDRDSYISQTLDYQDGLNSLTIDQYLSNYEQYIENGGSKGRSSETFDAAKTAQGNYHTAIEETYQTNTKGLDALHNPDLSMGGEQTNVTGLGLSGVNRSIGSQMGHQSAAFHDYVTEMSKDMSQEEKEQTHLNVFIKVNS